jgi:hypothetical protein
MVLFLITGPTKKGKDVPVKDSVFSNPLEVRVLKEKINTRILLLSDFGLTKSGSRWKLECINIVTAIEEGRAASKSPH